MKLSKKLSDRKMLMIAEIGGNSKVFHSIEMANMGLGSLICFIVLYLLYQKQDETV